MEMTLKMHENSILNQFIKTVEKNSELVRAENGLSKMVIDNDLWEEMKYQMYLQKEVDKAKQSIANGNSHSVEDFRKRYGLT